MCRNAPEFDCEWAATDAVSQAQEIRDEVAEIQRRLESLRKLSARAEPWMFASDATVSDMIAMAAEMRADADYGVDLALEGYDTWENRGERSDHAEHSTLRVVNGSVAG